jgi:hypothetical protein
VVDLEGAQAGGRRRAVGEAVQAGAQEHVLVKAAVGQLGQALLGVTAADGDLGPGAGQDDVVAAALVVADHLGARSPDQVGGHRVAEDQGLLVDHQVGRAGRGAASAAWLGCRSSMRSIPSSRELRGDVRDEVSI